MLIGTVIMSFDLNQIYEDPHSYDVYNPDLSLSSVLAGSDQFGPVMCPSDTSAMWYPSDTSAMWCPSDTSATLQHLPPPNEPPLHFQDFFAPKWNELPNNQPQKNVNHTIVLPGMSSHTSQCPLVLKLEPIRCLFVKDWVLACERKSRAHFSDDVVELVDSLIDPRKICHKKPEELKMPLCGSLGGGRCCRVAEVSLGHHMAEVSLGYHMAEVSLGHMTGPNWSEPARTELRLRSGLYTS